MQANQPMAHLLHRLWRHISLHRRQQFGLLLVLMLFASFAEILSIGAVLPFLGVLTAPELVFEHVAAQPIIQTFGLTAPEQLLLPLTVAFGIAALIAGLMRLMLLWASARNPGGADVTALSRLLRTHPAHFSRADVVELRRRFAAKFPGQELPS